MMIEEVIIKYLNQNSAVPAYAEKPLKPSNQFLIVEKTGSTHADMLGRATIVVQSHAESMYEAASLNETVKGLMKTMPELLPTVSDVTVNSDYNYTDTTKKKYRYQAVFDVVYYE